MKYFTDLLSNLELIDEGAAETRQKAKEFKSSMKPIIKRVKDAEIGDPRRYAYMLAWPFMRDELNIEEIQGQDTPVNSALIQRKLEQLYDEGRLPEDAGKQFEAYANREYDTYVNVKSAMRPRNKGEFVGFDENESASERAARNQVERELQQAKAAEPVDHLDVDVSEVDAEFRNVVSDIADSIGMRSSTSIIEVFFNPADGPIVQKQPILSLFPQEDLAGEPEIEPTKFVFELLPKSKISKLIIQRGAESIEDYLQKLFTDRLDRQVRVVVHAPEEGGTYTPISDAEPDVESGSSADSGGEYDTDSMSQFGGVSYESYRDPRGKSTRRNTYGGGGYSGSGAGGTFTVELPQGSYEVQLEGGNVRSITPVGDAPELDFNLKSVSNYIKQGWKPKDALISGRNTRGPSPQTATNPDVSQFIPESWKVQQQKYVKPNFETSRERYVVRRNGQIPLYNN